MPTLHAAVLPGQVCCHDEDRASPALHADVQHYHPYLALQSYLSRQNSPEGWHGQLLGWSCGPVGEPGLDAVSTKHQKTCRFVITGIHGREAGAAGPARAAAHRGPPAARRGARLVRRGSNFPLFSLPSLRNPCIVQW